MPDRWVYLPSALSIPALYVGSLYIFDRGDLHSDHPSTVRARFVGVSVSTGLSLAGTYYLLSRDFAKPLQMMGLVLNSDAIKSSAQALLLTSSVYTGSLCMQFLDDGFASLICPRQWRRCLCDIRWWRDVFMAPLTEELAFRSCAAVLMTHGLGPRWALFGSPLLFSLSHYHHLHNDVRHGQSLATALLTRSVQAIYTYLFGVYATFISLKSGFVLPAILSHSLCNCMGLPRIDEVQHYADKYKPFLLLAHLGGLGLFIWGISAFNSL